MIRYDLQCARGHAFEGWFGGSSDYDEQAQSGQLTCPECGSAKVEKAIMAPAVKTSRQAEARRAKMDAIAGAIRNEIAETCDDVGDGFAQEARAMFYGETSPRGIYGQATADEAQSLAEDGIPAIPLPDALDPKRASKKLN